jgi:hypothetical protein
VLFLQVLCCFCGFADKGAGALLLKVGYVILCKLDSPVVLFTSDLLFTDRFVAKLGEVLLEGCVEEENRVV